jgi:hypothetical protein
MKKENAEVLCGTPAPEKTLKVDPKSVCLAAKNPMRVL